jgi:hypothetical protein
MSKRILDSDKLQAFADGLAALTLEDNHLLLQLAEGDPLAVPVADILCITPAKRGVKVALSDGRELVTRASENLVTLGTCLAAHPNIVRTHNSYLVNLDQVARVARLDSDQNILTFYNGQTAPVTTNQNQVMAYFGIESLDHVIPWNERLAAIIAENLRTFDKDIRFMSDDEIRANFSTKSTGELIIRQLIGNIVWQVYNWIQEGKEPTIDGNIRSFWYSHIKPVLARFFKLSESFYNTLTDVFAQYVGVYHLFRYSDFGFVDDSGASKSVGTILPHIIMCAEKEGHLMTLQKIQADTGVTIIALGGQPSLLTTEGLTDDLAKVTTLKQTFHLVTDVDYDPAGNIIAESFRRQLAEMGVDSVTRVDIIQPENFTADELKYFRYPVANDTPADKAKTRDWMDKNKSPFGGGLPGDDGKPVPYGIESDAMDRQRIHDLAVAAIKQLAGATSKETWSEILARIRRHRPPIKGFPYL